MDRIDILDRLVGERYRYEALRGVVKGDQSIVGDRNGPKEPRHRGQGFQRIAPRKRQAVAEVQEKYGQEPSPEHIHNSLFSCPEKPQEQENPFEEQGAVAYCVHSVNGDIRG